MAPPSAEVPWWGCQGPSIQVWKKFAVTRSPVLGLDLQGGLEVVLEAQAPPGQEVTEEDLDRSIEIMRNRIDKLGVSEPEIRKQGSDQIVIELAGVHDQGRAAELIVFNHLSTGASDDLVRVTDIARSMVTPDVSMTSAVVPVVP